MLQMKDLRRGFGTVYDLALVHLLFKLKHG